MLSCSSRLIATVAKEQLDEFVSVQPALWTPPPWPQDRWQPLPSDFVKINFNDAIFAKENKSGIVVVVHDAQGSMLALSQQLSQVYSPLEIEVKGVAIALQFVADLWFAQVILEGDSQVLMLALINNSMFLSTNGLFIEDVCFCAIFLMNYVTLM